MTEPGGWEIMAFSCDVETDFVGLLDGSYIRVSCVITYGFRWRI